MADGHGRTAKDVNYVIPRFVLDHLPIGSPGLFIAAVIAAAMNAISGELNSLSTATRDRFLSSLGSPRGDRRAFPRRVARRDGVLGLVRVRRRDVCRRTSDRSSRS